MNHNSHNYMPIYYFIISFWLLLYWSIVDFNVVLILDVQQSDILWSILDIHILKYYIMTKGRLRITKYLVWGLTFGKLLEAIWHLSNKLKSAKF